MQTLANLIFLHLLNLVIHCDWPAQNSHTVFHTWPETWRKEKLKLNDVILCRKQLFLFAVQKLLKN